MNPGPGETGGHQPLTDTELTPDNIVAFLADVFARRGAEEYLGEPVTMAEHMLQAAQCAQDAGQTPAVIVAALLHDDTGKCAGVPTKTFTDYAPMVQQVVDSHCVAR